MSGSGDGAGGDDESGKKENDEEGDSNIPKPFNKLHYKMAKLGFSFTDDEKAAPSTAAPVESETVQESKRLKTSSSSWLPLQATTEEIPKTPSPPHAPSQRPGTIFSFGPFSPSASSNVGQNQNSESKERPKIRIKIIGPKPPAPSEPEPEPAPEPRLLTDGKTTYLRSARRPSKYPAEPDPDRPMGPPERGICRSPYQTVKKALTYLKGDLPVTSTVPDQPEEELDPFAPAPPPAPYVLEHFTKDRRWTVDEVVRQLDAYMNKVPAMVSSEALKKNLREFQKRLGVPTQRGFYELMWKSALEFQSYLARYLLFDYQVAAQEGGGEDGGGYEDDNGGYEVTSRTDFRSLDYGGAEAAMEIWNKYQCSSTPYTAAEFASLVPKTPSPPFPLPLLPLPGPASDFNFDFGPFPPSGSSTVGQSSDSNKGKRVPKLPIWLKSPRPLSQSEPEPELRPRLLEESQITYLRPGPAHRPPASPNTLMGPPPHRICRTPYQKVKRALTFSKQELGLTSFPQDQLAEVADAETGSDPLPWYSLADFRPDLSTVEEVVLELEEYLYSMPRFVSSDEMKERLAEFQAKLGLPRRPYFYYLMCVGALEFLLYLRRFFLFERNLFDDAGGDSGGGGN